MIRRINASLESGGRLQGFVWFQGESDAALEVESQVYHQNLINFFKDLRDDLNQPTLPILLVCDLFLSFIFYFSYFKFSLVDFFKFVGEDS